MSQKKELLN